MQNIVITVRAKKEATHHVSLTSTIIRNLVEKKNETANSYMVAPCSQQRRLSGEGIPAGPHSKHKFISFTHSQCVKHTDPPYSH